MNESYYNIIWDNSHQTLYIEIDDLLGTKLSEIGFQKDSMIEVCFCGRKNENFQYGTTGNKITCYSSLRNRGSTSESNEWKSDEQTVVAIAYTLLIKKQDNKGNPLSGAYFELRNGNEFRPKTILPYNYQDGDTEFLFQDISDQDYWHLAEINTPSNYLTAEEVVFNFWYSMGNLDYGAFTRNTYAISPISAGWEPWGERNFPGLELDADGNFVITIPNTPLPGFEESEESFDSPLPLTGAPLLLPQIPGILLVGISILRKKRRREE